MIVGYARTSTIDQSAGFEAQLKELAAAGCERTYQEQVSSVVARKQLQAAMEYVREGDIFVVAKLDRLARSVPDLMTILQAFGAQTRRGTNSEPRHGHPDSHRKTDADSTRCDRAVRERDDARTATGGDSQGQVGRPL